MLEGLPSSVDPDKSYKIRGSMIQRLVDLVNAARLMDVKWPLKFISTPTDGTCLWLDPEFPKTPRPILARVTAVHENYLVAKRVDGGLAVTGDEFNVAKPLEVRVSTYADETHIDPLDADVTLTYSYASAQERTVFKDDDGTETTENQRIVPWYVPHATTGSLIQIIGYPATVKDDDGTTDVVCSFTEHDSPRAWAKV